MIKVLLVDDSLTVRRRLRQVLDKCAGVVVCGEAGNGREALAQAANLRPDVIVMPEMDGTEATHRLMAEHPGPVIIISSSRNRGGKQHCAGLDNGRRCGSSIEKTDMEDDAAAWEKNLFRKCSGQM